MTLGETIIIFRSISGLFLGLTIFGLLVLPDEPTLIQFFRIMSMLIFAVATLTPVASYHDRIRYIYTGLYIFGMVIALPLILHAYHRETGGPDYAVMIFRALQVEVFLIFTVITLNSATTTVKSDSDLFR